MLQPLHSLGERFVFEVSTPPRSIPFSRADSISVPDTFSGFGFLLHDSIQEKHGKRRSFLDGIPGFREQLHQCALVDFQAGHWAVSLDGLVDFF